ncbi:MAG TPA: hypothetical protein GX707_11985 [Epulopiscium sp.]|nr:hypothetical protein [Candidatus Epulonipiscium sp.]
MKFSKKTATICAFALGATLLTTSAFADIMLGSGYYSLKNSVKTTMAKLTNEVDNFTAEATISLKVDGKVFMESISNAKYDIKNQAQESRNKDLEKGEIRESSWYSDKKQSIYKNSDDGSYKVTEKRKTNNKTSKIIENPFEDEQMKDAEKVLDAFMGSLQNAIQVEESAGKKMYVGNLSETQIPSIANAVSSFIFKYSILDERSAKDFNVPSPKSNIYLTDASGKAIENEEGILESGIFTASISAQDSKGTEHIYSLEFSIDIKDVNSTVVKAPNLDGQKVTYSTEGQVFDSKYVGKYKNDIVKVENNSFEKRGERFIEITSVENGNIKGKYYETYNEGYEAEATTSFDFYSSDDQINYYTIINYTNGKGEKQKGVIDRYGSNSPNIDIAFNVRIDKENGGYSHETVDGFDRTFIRVFE